jgi:hypothetical protein
MKPLTNIRKKPVMNSVIELKRITRTLLIAFVPLLIHSTAFATPNNNTSFGVQSGPAGGTGEFNTALGYNALSRSINNNENTAVGALALFNSGNANLGNSNRNTAIGTQALEQLGFIPTVASTGNIAVGYKAGYNLTFGNNNMCIGNQGVANDSNTIRIGDNTHTKTFVAGINGVAVSGAGVLVNANGQLGVAASSARFKDEIKLMGTASEAILRLKPVSFHYKKDIDPARTSQFGLVAEDVETVSPELVAHDKEGKPYTVRYDSVNAMLLNEFLKEHRKVEQLEATVAQQHRDFETAVAELIGQIQKLGAQFELNKPTKQTVLNSR